MGHVSEVSRILGIMYEVFMSIGGHIFSTKEEDPFVTLKGGAYFSPLRAQFSTWKRELDRWRPPKNSGDIS